MTNRRTFLSALGAGCTLLRPSWAQSQELSHQLFWTVETNSGKVQGIANTGIKEFKGIPYGAPTGGKNRYLPPQKPASWTGVRECLGHGPISPQTLSNLAGDYGMLIQWDQQVGGMSEDCLTNVIQEEPRRRLGTLNCREDGHAQIFQRCVHLAMGPSERIRHCNTVFVGKLLERYARYIELHDVDRIGKERNWILFQIEDRHSSRRSFPSGHQFAGEPQTPSSVRAKMQVDRKCLLERNRAGRIGKAIRRVQSGDG